MDQPAVATISAQKIHKSYGALAAVDSLSFTVKPSTCFAFLGPNGAGKTTMMKILYGKAKRDKKAGTALSVLGFDPEKHELEIKSRTGVVPQEDNLDVELDVLANLKIYARFYHIPGKEARKRIDGLLEFMELSDKKRSRIRDLSGGMKRRLLIARALLGNPELLILDEPTTGLDPQVRQLIWDKLRQLKSQGVTILLTTHYMDEAFQIADNVMIMDQGKKLLEGNPRELLGKHMETWVLEVTDKAAAKSFDHAGKKKIRREDAGERVLFYSNDPGVLSKMAARLAAGQYHLRPVNLEDLFLRVTGRKLNEIQ
ncbi:MAG: ABC transporter ATP-binding protein [Spirochaetaceae bacterium]|nr:MAG: ABC transporter ATP-binding protein [Spirochaetaceae bacterium]